MEAGVFVLGMHRSGTSAATRLISFLGLATPRGDDLVQPSSKNPSGYWESMSLVALNIELLTAIGSDFTCPARLEPGWQRDPRLDGLRQKARADFRKAYPTSPWVWKDPRTCLTFSFWRSVLDVRPVVVLVNRNPLEIAASSARTRGDDDKIYTLATWERYLRQALQQIGGLPVLVVDYASVLSDPIALCKRAHTLLTEAGVPVQRIPEAEVKRFIDPELKHVAFTREEVLGDPDVSDAQRALFSGIEGVQGSHGAFVPPRGASPLSESPLGRARARQDCRLRVALSPEHGVWFSQALPSRAAPAPPCGPGAR